MPKRLLITGFDPFGGQSVNPAWEAVSRLPARVGDCVVHALQVPTVFGLAAQRVIEEAQALRPDVILCVGQAGGRAAVTPEMVAINLRYAAIPDNAGLQPQDIPCAEDGPAAYFATVPVREMARAIAQAGLPGSVSYTAGTFVCNNLLYTLLHHYHDTAVRVGFIHVPFLPGQAGEGIPSMPLEDIVRGLTLCVGALD